MKHPTTLLAATATLALTLGGCGDADDDVDAVVVAETTPAVTAEFDPMSRDYEMSDEAAERRGQFDEAAFQDEYAGYRDDIVSEQVEMMPSGDTTDVEAQAASQPRDANSNMRSRSNMTWSYLDRNGDGQLSVAEYAIWAIPLDPTEPKRNDETQPYLTSDQANKAADSFFYYDVDGDTYLSQREFTAARRGETIA